MPSLSLFADSRPYPARMKSTKVDKETGDVKCPKCGARSFTQKRSAKGKMMGGLMAPKRLKCDGCGTMLKRT